MLWTGAVPKSGAISLLAMLLIATTATGAHIGCATGNGADDDPVLPDAGSAAPDAATPEPTARRVVILMIGDGMGRGQIEAASRFGYGESGQLRMQAMPYHGDMITGSLSGITDSGAAATAMATGVTTLNARIGMDADGEAVETLVELAQREGLATGVVTTAALPHATPASFTAHRLSRHDYYEIAEQQALVVRPDVMLGGGMMYYGEILEALVADGAQVVTDPTGLAALEPGGRVVGLFADEHLAYARDADGTQPTLTEMTLAAVDRLDQNPDGFFLVVEGARIDMASHGNDIDNAVGETLAFDAAIAAVLDWAETRDEVAVFVTADHECGGLTATEFPAVGWRWGEHTNARVDLFAAGAGAERFDGAVVRFPELHAELAARITAGPVEAPPAVLVPDGHLAELGEPIALQQVASGFGAGFNQLDALYAATDERGLALGIEGVFQWNENAVAILIDIDPGASTGVASFGGAVADDSGRIDQILASLQVDMPEGFAADYAVVTWGGIDPHLEDRWADSGLRRLAPLDDLPWLGTAVNFGEGVRAAGAAIAPVPGEGLEVFIPWSTLLPDGEAPPGTTIGVVVILVNSDGGYASNQALPPFPAGTENPGRAVVQLPGYVSIAPAF